MRRTRLGVVATLFAAILSFGLAVVPAEAAKYLNRGNGAEPKGLDPHQASGDPENQILGDMFLGLYTEDVNGKAVLGAAEKVDVSADGLTWTFTIRDHKWSDGKPVTSADFVFAWRRVLDPMTASEYASILFPVKNAEKVSTGKLKLDELGVSAPNPKTFVVTLEHPAPYLPEMLTHYTTFPLPKHVIEKAGKDWTKPGIMVSNGAYKLATRRPNDHIKLVKNTFFYDAANVKIDEVSFFPTTDEPASLKRYRAGELDTLDRWPLTEFRWLSTNIPKETRKYTGLRVLYTVFNMRKGPLADKRVRLALGMAIDQATVQRDVYFGAFGVEAETILPPGLANVDRSATVPWSGKTMAERRAEAKRLLAEAGYGPGKPLKVSYNFINRPDSRRYAIALQAMWKMVGVQVELQAKEFAIHYDLLKTGNYEMGHAGWVFDYSDAQNVLFLFQSSNVGLNYPGYKNPAYDKLMAEADLEKDGVKRGKLLGQATKLLLDDMAVAPVCYQYVRPLVKPYVSNWMNTARGVNRTRYLDVNRK
jgi:oligopeptide transport system substrate-binding protein